MQNRTKKNGERMGWMYLWFLWPFNIFIDLTPPRGLLCMLWQYNCACIITIYILLVLLFTLWLPTYPGCIHQDFAVCVSVCVFIVQWIVPRIITYLYNNSFVHSHFYSLRLFSKFSIIIIFLPLFLLSLIFYCVKTYDERVVKVSLFFK